MAPVTTKGHADTQGCGQPPETMLVFKDHAAAKAKTDLDGRPPRGMVISGSELLPMAMSGPMAPQQPMSQLMSLTPVTTKGSADAQGLVSHPRPCWFPRAMLPLGPY